MAVARIEGGKVNSALRRIVVRRIEARGPGLLGRLGRAAVASGKGRRVALGTKRRMRGRVVRFKVLSVMRTRPRLSVYRLRRFRPVASGRARLACSGCVGR